MSAALQHPTPSRVFYRRPARGFEAGEMTRWNDYCNIIGVKTWVRLSHLSQSPSGSELALFEKPELSTTAFFRRLISSASSASAQTSIAARGTYHDRDHRGALQFVSSGKLPRTDRHHLGIRSRL